MLWMRFIRHGVVPATSLSCLMPVVDSPFHYAMRLA